MAEIALKRGDTPEARRLASEALVVFTELKMPAQTEAVGTLLEQIG
jgi:hypothetical protein